VKIHGGISIALETNIIHEIFHHKNKLFFANKNNPNLRFLNLRFDIKNNVLWVFFYSYFNKNERKKI